LASKKKQKLAEVPKSYCGLPKMGTFELSHISDFHFSLLLRLTLFEPSALRELTDRSRQVARRAVPKSGER
jgi:hypothetical protein